MMQYLEMWINWYTHRKKKRESKREEIKQKTNIYIHANRERREKEPKMTEWRDGRKERRK